MIYHSQNWGGIRPGAGRPRKLHGRSTSKTIKVSAMVARYLEDLGGGQAEKAIRASAGFKKWKSELTKTHNLS